MDKIIQPSNPVTGVLVGPTATCDLPIGPRYLALDLMIVATGIAATVLKLSDVLALINVKINGKVQRAHLATELDQVQTDYSSLNSVKAYNCTGAGNTLALVYSGGAPQAPQAASQTAFFVRLNFAEPWRKSYAAQNQRAWPTAWQDGSVLKSLSLDLAIPNTGNVDGTKAFSINVSSVTDNQLGTLDPTTKKPITNICKWYRQQVPYTAAGDLPIVNLIKTSPGILAVAEQHTFFMPGTDTIERIIATADTRTIRDVIKPVNDQLLLDHLFNPSFQNAFVWELVYDYTDLPTDGLVLATANGAVGTYKMVLSLSNVAAANAMTVISQVYGPID